jgi:VWFA-related protein
MKRILIAWALATIGLAAQPPQQPVFRGGAETVPVFVTVTDDDGRLVPDLPREAFQVRDNGKPQPITVFDNSPQPIRLIVLVDASGSMFRNLQLLRAAAAQIVAHLGPGDLARVGTFGERIDLGTTFTRDPDELIASLPRDIPADAPTPLWTAIDQAIDEIGQADGRPVVLVMSDSKDSGPRFRQRWVSQIEAEERANREDVMIYGVGVHSRGARPSGSVFGGGRGGMMGALVANLPDPGLGTVALNTGGGYFELRPRDDLGQVFARVMDELHHQYLLGFTPPAQDGKDHDIDVRVEGDDLKPRARKSYRAPGD